MRLIDDFLQGRPKSTQKAYRDDFERFRQFMGAESADAAVDQLLALGQVGAHEKVDGWRAAMISSGLRPVSVNRALSPIRSIVKHAVRRGRVAWMLLVQNAKTRPRDSPWVTRQEFHIMLGQLAGRDDAKSLRDVAIIRLVWDALLKPGQVAALALSDFDPDTKCVWFTHRGARRRLGLRIETALSLKRWRQTRPPQDGPLFVSLDNAHAHVMHRMSKVGIWNVVNSLGGRAGIRARPGGLRKGGIVDLLNRGASLPTVQERAGIANVLMLARIDQERRQVARKLPRALDGESNAEDDE